MSISALRAAAGTASPAGNDFLRPARRKGPWAAVLVAIVIAVAGVVAGAVLTHRTMVDATAQPVMQPSAPTPAASAASGAAEGAGAAGAAGSVLKLVAGSRMVNGVAVGYPRTPAGAVSAGAEYLTQMGTFDPDRQAAVGRAIGESSWTGVGEEFGQAAQDSRKGYGLPPTGPLPSGSSLQVSPQQYQIYDTSTPGRITVLFLSYLVVTTPTQGTTSTAIIEPADLVWDHGDWKLARTSDADQSPLRRFIATPYSDQAAARGWRDMQA